MARIEVTEPVHVRIAESVYLIEPIWVNGNRGHLARKIKVIIPDKFRPLGYAHAGTGLYLAVGEHVRMDGDEGFISSKVLEVTPVE